MQIVKCFEASLDEHGEYEFETVFFSSNRSPDPFWESSRGILYKHFSIIEGDVTYVVYALGEPTQEKKTLIEQAWNNYCV